MARMAVVLTGLEFDWPSDCLPHRGSFLGWFATLFTSLIAETCRGLSLILMASLIAETFKVSRWFGCRASLIAEAFRVSRWSWCRAFYWSLIPKGFMLTEEWLDSGGEAGLGWYSLAAPAGSWQPRATQLSWLAVAPEFTSAAFSFAVTDSAVRAGLHLQSAGPWLVDRAAGVVCSSQFSSPRRTQLCWGSRQVLRMLDQ